MDIKEIHHRNDGRDIFPFLICRHRFPKDRLDVDPDFNAGILELSENEVREYFGPSDFAIGKTILVYNRPLLLYDCDNFTKAYYWKNYGTTDFTPVDISRTFPEFRKKVDLQTKIFEMLLLFTFENHFKWNHVVLLSGYTTLEFPRYIG